MCVRACVCVCVRVGSIVELVKHREKLLTPDALTAELRHTLLYTSLKSKTNAGPACMTPQVLRDTVASLRRTPLTARAAGGRLEACAKHVGDIFQLARVTE